CEGPQPSKLPPIIVATIGWPLLADPLGRPLRRRREAVLVYGRPRLRGTAALRAPPIIVATTGWSLLADPLEGVRSVDAVKECRLSREIRLTQNPKPFADERGPAAFMVIQVKRHG